MADLANSGGKDKAAKGPETQAPGTGGGTPGGGKKADRDESSLGGVIDTIEAVIIALIVALTFRAFIVEAFVIPTGSMAPTLLGAHFKVICPKCGYEFDWNARLDHQLQLLNGQYVIPARGNEHAELGPNDLVPCDDLSAHPLYCPNCRYAITDARTLPQFLNKRNLMDSNGNRWNGVSFAWANNGDRILVLKYLYSVLEPRPWDVIVFKEPQEGRDNYIKRLIGLPRDTVQIVNGDVYIGKEKAGQADARRREIARKPEDIQRSLWQLVFDNDYYPSDERTRGQDPRDPQTAWVNPWAPEAPAGWTRGTTWGYAGAAAAALVFHPVPPGMPADYPPYGLNTLGYNNDLYADEYRSMYDFSPKSMVGDLRLETLWTPRAGGAEGVKLTLGRPNNCYQVNWSAAGLTLAKYDAATKSFVRAAATLTRKLAPPQAGDSYRLALDNVDHAVRFDVDGVKVLEFAAPWTAQDAIDDVQQHPADWTNSPGMRSPAEVVDTIIRIDVAGPCELSHLKVYRDLFYTQLLQAYADRMNRKGTATQDNPLTLGDDEFFALGDNSRQSNDGRLWSRVYDPLADLALRPGVVPRRYLLGKAFYVYWPAGFRATTALPQVRNWPIIPNTGDMRIIR